MSRRLYAIKPLRSFGVNPSTCGRPRRRTEPVAREVAREIRGRNTFDSTPKAGATDLAGDFMESASLLQGARRALLTKGEISLLVRDRYVEIEVGIDN